MAHLSPSAIFSPSIARQQLAAAKDWNYIDAWLSTKFSGKTPPFERNNETPKSASCSRSLERKRRRGIANSSHASKPKALADLRAKQEADANVELLRLIEESLTPEGQTSLETLASLSVEMNQPIPDTEKLGRSLIDLQVQAYDLEQVSDTVSILENHLNAELEKINQLIEELHSDAYQPPADVDETND